MAAVGQRRIDKSLAVEVQARVNYLPAPALNRPRNISSSMVVSLPRAKTMASIDDFRIESHKLLMELDAATMGMMMLVSARCVSGPDWDVARKRQHDAYERWDAFINFPTVVGP